VDAVAHWRRGDAVSPRLVIFFDDVEPWNRDRAPSTAAPCARREDFPRFRLSLRARARTRPPARRGQLSSLEMLKGSAAAFEIRLGGSGLCPWCSCHPAYRSVGWPAARPFWLARQRVGISRKKKLLGLVVFAHGVGRNETCQLFIVIGAALGMRGADLVLEVPAIRTSPSIRRRATAAFAFSLLG